MWHRRDCRLPRSWDRSEPSVARAMDHPGCQSGTIGVSRAGFGHVLQLPLRPGRWIWERRGVAFRGYPWPMSGRCCGAGWRRRPAHGGRAGRVDGKTARRYVRAGQAAGLVRDGGVEQLNDDLLGRWWPRCARLAWARRGRRCRAARSRSGTGSARRVWRRPTCTASWPAAAWTCRSTRCGRFAVDRSVVSGGSRRWPYTGDLLCDALAHDGRWRVGRPTLPRARGWTAKADHVSWPGVAARDAVASRHGVLGLLVLAGCLPPALQPAAVFLATLGRAVRPWRLMRTQAATAS